MASDSSRICIFVRHGESQTNVSHIRSRDLDKYPLTDAGALMVEEAAAKLSRLGGSVKLYSSPILRARQTAEIISKHLKIEPEMTPLLMERGFGKYNNTSFQAGNENRRVLREQIASNYPDWESWQEMASRMMEFSKRVKPGRISVAVTHMDPIKALVGHLVGKEEPLMLDVYFKNASFNVIDFARSGEEAILATDSSELPNGLRGKS
jgi:probable phosphoglycerate mutase